MSKTSQNQAKWQKFASGLLVLINLILGVYFYPQLPDTVPSHWNAAGQIDSYAGRFWGAFGIPLLILGIFVLFFIIPRIDPKKANYAKMGRVFWIFSFSLVLFLSILYWSVLGVALGYLKGLPRWYFGGIGILFIIIGNYYGKIKFNYTFGLRTPWTIANEEVWYKTHRIAGPIWMAGGFLLLFTGLLPVSWAMPWFFTIIVVITLVPTLYSYQIFKRLGN